MHALLNSMAKYPVIFRVADLVLISKCDLLPVLDDFNPDNAKQHLQNLASSAPVVELSSKDNKGVNTWLNWLRKQKKKIITHNKKPHAHTHHHSATSIA